MSARRPRILHIGPDSPFLAFAARTFESVAPGSNAYLVVNGTSPDSLANPLPAGTVRVVPNSVVGILGLLRRRIDADLVIAHSMTGPAAAVFARAGRSTATVWSGWGYDYYGTDTGDDGGLYGPRTAAVVDELSRSQAGERGALDLALGPWRAFARRLTRRAAARADFFSAPVPADEPVFRARYPRFAGRYAQLSYASLEDSFQAGDGTRPPGDDILIGNSATPSNNHIEAFELLAGRDLGTRRVVVPLNYGDPRYRDIVLGRGRELLGDAFAPLIEHLPLDEYNALVSGCGLVIMNSRRQQALGNIGTALQAGAEVVLDPANPVYGFLRAEGVAVRSTAELSAREDVLGRPLDAAEIAADRAFVARFWGAERVEGNAAALVASALELVASRR